MENNKYIKDYIDNLKKIHIMFIIFLIITIFNIPNNINLTKLFLFLLVGILFFIFEIMRYKIILYKFKNKNWNIFEVWISSFLLVFIIITTLNHNEVFYSLLFLVVYAGLKTFYKKNLIEIMNRLKDNKSLDDE